MPAPAPLLFYLGGEGPTFPAIKIEGTSISFVLADDSGFTTFRALGAGIGMAPSAYAHLAVGACQAAKAQIFLPPSSDPTGPHHPGQVWFDGNVIKYVNNAGAILQITAEAVP